MILVSIDWATVWKVLNSPFVITALTISGGVLLANWLAGQWQLRAMRYQLKLELYQKFHSMIGQLATASKFTPSDIERLVILKQDIFLVGTVFEHNETRSQIGRFFLSLEVLNRGGEGINKDQATEISESHTYATQAMLRELGIKPLEDDKKD